MSTSTTEITPSEFSEVTLSCPICMESYSSTRYPVVAPECAHSICVDCGKERKSNICVTCESRSFSAPYNFTSGHHTRKALPSELWKKNFALMDLIEQNDREKLSAKCAREQSEREKQRLREEVEELKKKFEELASNDIDFMECFNCKSKEKRERMKICGTCVEKWNKEWKGMKEEEIFPFIICSFCCGEDHPGHSIVKYLPWKLKKLLTTTVSDGNSTVFSMDEICAHEIEKGKEQLGKWNEKMSCFGFIEFKTYRGGLSIVDSLKKESDLVCRASEDTLPTLRMYTKVVTDSISRLDLLKEGEGAKK